MLVLSQVPSVNMWDTKTGCSLMHFPNICKCNWKRFSCYIRKVYFKIYIKPDTLSLCNILIVWLPWAPSVIQCNKDWDRGRPPSLVSGDCFGYNVQTALCDILWKPLHPKLSSVIRILRGRHSFIQIYASLYCCPNLAWPCRFSVKNVLPISYCSIILLRMWRHNSKYCVTDVTWNRFLFVQTIVL